MVERWKDRLSSRSGGADRPDPRNASPGSSAGDPRQRWLPLLWVGVALVLFFSLEGVLFNQPENITFSRFLDLVQSKQVEKVDVAQDSISGTYRSQGGKEQSFSTTMPPGYDTTQLIKTLNSQGAEVRASQPSALPGAAPPFSTRTRSPSPGRGRTRARLRGRRPDFRRSQAFSARPSGGWESPHALERSRASTVPAPTASTREGPGS